MRLNKEQILFLVVVALAAWIWQSQTATELPRTAQSKSLAYEAPPPVAVALADPTRAVEPAKDLFREPSEAVPLPPRELPWPALAPMPVVATPLDPGPEAGAWRLLRIEGGPPAQHAFGAASRGDGAEPEDGAADADPDAEPAPAVAAQDPAGDRLPVETLVKRFDRIWLESSRNPFFGVIQNADKYDLVGRSAETLPQIVFDQVTMTGRLMQRGWKPENVVKVELADSLENRVALRKRTLPDGQAGVQPRIEFLDWLLEEARGNPWVYQEAEAQAARIFADSGQNELGYREMIRVLRAQGEVAREFDLYRNASGPIAESAARWREQGRLEARLTLWADAEEHLRKAVAIAPSDPRSLAALAGFLLEQGRAAEAEELAVRARRGINTVLPEEDRVPLLRTIASVHLALGNVEEAASTVGRIGNAADPAERALLRGAVAYAGGDGQRDAAAEQFERAAAEAARADALLGLAAVRLRQGVWNEAKALFERVRDESPSLRARANAGLALLYERTGHPDRAREAIDLARRHDPSDPYAIYLAGRFARLAGDFEAAVALQREALAQRDDLTEALGESALALLAAADALPDGGADLLARAVPYAERLVDLDGRDQGDGRSAPRRSFLELEGYVLARVGSVGPARRSLQDAALGGSDFADLGLAILDYRANRAAQARARLVTIADDLNRGTGTRDEARRLIRLIDDHASKEVVRDDFERDTKGGFWENAVGLRPKFEDGGVVFRGPTGRAGEPTWLRRRPIRGGDLLSVAVTMRLGAQVSGTNFAGLRLGLGGNTSAFQVRLGFSSGSGGGVTPKLIVEDGRGGSNSEPYQELLSGDLGTVDPTEPQRLAVEVFPLADEGSAANQLGMRVLWNDVVVHQVERLSALTARTTADLEVDLRAEGSQVDVRFDDFRMVRRRAQ